MNCLLINIVELTGKFIRAQILSAFAAIPGIILGHVGDVVQLNTVVVLLGVDTLLIGDRVDAAALSEALTFADVGDVLKDAVDSALVRITEVLPLRG